MESLNFHLATRPQEFLAELPACTVHVKERGDSCSPFKLRSSHITQMNLHLAAS